MKPITDPVQVVADAIRSTYFRPGDDLAEQTADLAVAALKANPEALAALLEPVAGWWVGPFDEVVRHPTDPWHRYPGDRRLYRMHPGDALWERDKL